jgi:hypothetical protein
MIARDVFRLHPDDWEDKHWLQARDFIALRLVEMDEEDDMLDG